MFEKYLKVQYTFSVLFFDQGHDLPQGWPCTKIQVENKNYKNYLWNGFFQR